MRTASARAGEKNHGYTYQAALAAAHRVNWRIEGILGAGQHLNFRNPFLPESLARSEPLTFLCSAERKILNQIRGNAYLCIFGLVEEFILPFVMDHARPFLNEDDYRVRALLQFAGEEAKHIQLFKRFRDEFARGFRRECAIIGPPDAIAKTVLAHDPLAVAITILHVEWMTQRHFQESVRDNMKIDPLFKSLLKHHWMEEAQHARLDTLIVEALAEGRNEGQITTAIEGYLEIAAFLDGGLKQQAMLDLQSFESAAGRVLSDEERGHFLMVQTQANRWTYLGSGMTHPNFLATLESLSPGGRMKVSEISPSFK